MPRVTSRQLSITLPVDMANMLQAKVDTGEYASVSSPFKMPCGWPKSCLPTMNSKQLWTKVSALFRYANPSARPAELDRCAYRQGAPAPH